MAAAKTEHLAFKLACIPALLIVENIGLPDSLLSRFDLLFVVLDQLDPDLDRRIASHVIRGHGYRSVTGKTVYDSDEEEDDDLYDESNGERPRSIWQRSRYSYDTHHDEAEDSDEAIPNNDMLQHDFLRKYIHFAKNLATKIKPTLTEEARESIAAKYAEMRSRQDERTLPITARSLETVIRLASSHAKARLSSTVEAEPDVKVAIDVMSYALYHENHQTSPAQERVSTPDLRDDRRRSRMDLESDGEEGEEGNDSNKKQKQISDSPNNLGKQIFDELRANGDTMKISDICKDVVDRSIVEKIILKWETEDKVVMTGDGDVFFV